MHVRVVKISSRFACSIENLHIVVSLLFVCQNIALQLLEIAQIDSTDKICEVSQPSSDDDTINFLLAVADNSADMELDKHTRCSHQGMVCQNISALEFDNHERLLHLKYHLCGGSKITN